MFPFHVHLIADDGHDTIVFRTIRFYDSQNTIESYKDLYPKKENIPVVFIRSLIKFKANNRNK
jgi:hypothetical protein